MLRRAVLAFLVAAALGGCGQAEPTPERLPDVVLPGLRATDADLDLGALKGPALINVWASYCEPCRTEMPLLADFARANPDLTVIGVDYTDPDRDKAIKLARRSGVDYHLVVDDEGALPARFLPQWIVVDDRGVVTWRKYAAIDSASELEDLVKEHVR